MHIIIGLLSAIGLLVMVLWRISMAIQASREIAGAAQDAKGFFRRHKWKNKVNADKLKQIEDPREAAVIMMVAVAESDGSISDRECKKILHIIMTKFEASQKVAEEFLAQARWMTKDAGDLTSFLNRLKPVIQRSCDATQKRELIEMLKEVAEVDGRHEGNIHDSIDRLQYNLG